ncbi:MAG TPA: nuclear transport factor 2 family protein [Acidimicrobiales bacterium]|nr:nuclear transport factor 2 family protein [Acidimicrobiales bacterium]
MSNAAVRGARRFHEMFNRGALDEVPGQRHPDFRWEDRRRVLADRVLQTESKADEQNAANTAFAYRSGAKFEPEEVLVLRGDDLALVRVALRGPSAEWSFLIVVRMAPDGRLLDYVMFDPEDRNAANVELDRLTPGELEGDTSAWRVARRQSAAENARDWDRFVGHLAPGYERGDRRETLLHVPSDADPLEIHRTLFALDDHATERNLIETSGERRVLVHDLVWFRDGSVDEAEVPGISLLEVDDAGLIVRMVGFDETGLEAARAELHRPAVGDSAAWRAAQRMHEAINAHDWEALVACVAPSFDGLDRRTGVAAPDSSDALDGYRLLFSLDDWSMERRLLESVDDRGVIVHDVVWFRDGEVADGEVESLKVYEVDDAGLLTRQVTLDPDDLAGARAELDNRAATLATRVVQRFADAVNAHDWDGVVAVLAPDVRFTDRRRAVTAPDEARLINTYELLFTLDDWSIDRTILQGHGDRRVLVRDVVWFRSLDVVESEIESLNLYDVDAAGRIVRMVSFAPEDLDIAREELVSVPAVMPTSFDNEAWRAARRMDIAYQQDREGFAALVAPGFEYHENLRSADLHIRGAEAVDLYLQRRDMAALHEWSVARTLRATRGQRLCLCEDRIGFLTGDAGPSEAVCLTVVELADDGRVLRCSAFELDDVDGAFGELDRRYLDQGGLDLRRYHEAVARRDWDEVRELFSPSATVVDHRSLSFGTLDVDAFIAYSSRNPVVLSSDFRTHVAHVLDSNPAGMLVVISDAGSQDGGDYEILFLCLTRLDGAGLVERIDTYDLDQLDVARAELDRLVAPDRAAPVQPNAAWLAEERLEAAFNAQDFGLVRSHLSPRFTYHDRRATMLVDAEGEEALSIFRVGVALDEFRISNRLLATRGEGLALVEQQAVFQDGASGPSEVRTLTVLELDQDGQMLRHAVFEATAMEDALAYLDNRARLARPLANEAWRVSQRFTAAYNARDRAALESLHSPGYSYHDRRGAVTNVDYYGEEAFRQFDFALALDEFHLERRLVATRGEHVVLVEEHARFRDGATGPAEIDCLTVFEIDGDGRALRNTCFEPTAMADALAELEARHASGDRFRPRANLAWRAAVRQREASDAADWDAFAATLAPSFEYVDRRRVMWVPPAADPHAIYRQMFALDEWTFRRALLATRGEHLALVRTTVEFRDGEAGPSEVTTISVTEVGPDGLIVREAAFDVDQLDEAVAELDARWEAVQERVTGNAAWRAVEALDAASDTADWDAFRALLHDDYRAIDRRSVVSNKVMAHETYEVLFSLDEWRLHHDLVDTRGDELVLVRTTVWIRDGAAGPAEIPVLTLFEIAPDGRILSETGFDVDDLDRATAALEARWGELQAEPGGVEGNLSWRTMCRLSGRSGDFTWDELVSLFHPGNVWEDRRWYWSLPAHDGNHMLEAYRTLFEVDEWELRRTLVATRGDHLALLRTHTLLRDGETGPAEVETLALNEVAPDGRILRQVLFEPDDLDAAMAELDRRWAELQAEPPAPVPNRAWEVERSAMDAFDRRDWDGFVEHYEPTWEFDERRPGTLGRTTGPDAFAATHMAFDLDATWEARLIASAGDRLALVDATVRGTDGEVAEFEVPTLTVVELGIDDRICRRVTFEVEDLGAAMAELRERQRLLEDPLAIPRNLAVRSVERPGWALVAALGEHVCLHDTDSGTIVHEVDDAGQVDAALTFPADIAGRRAAFDELVRRGYARLGFPQAVTELTHAALYRDVNALASLLTESCEIEDHRRFHADDPQDAAAYVSDLVGSAGALAPDHVVEILREEAPGTDPWGHIAVIRLVGSTEDGAAFESPYLTVASWDETGRFADIALYDVEDIDLARVHLAARRPAAPVSTDPLAIPRNLAVRRVAMPGWTLLAALGEHLCLHDTGERLILHEVDDRGEVTVLLAFDRADRPRAAGELAQRAYERAGVPMPAAGAVAAINAHDAAVTQACYADPFTWEDHRRLRVVTMEDYPDVAGWLAGGIELAPDFSVEILRVDAMEAWGLVVLNRQAGTTRDGTSFETFTLSCSCWDDDGRITLGAIYDPEDIGAALARLQAAAPGPGSEAGDAERQLQPPDDPLAIPRNLAVRSVAKPGWTRLAALGEHLCLHDTGERLVLHEVDDAGEVIAFQSYSRDDRRTAFDEVSTRAFARYGVPVQSTGMLPAMNARDIEAFRACLSDDCRVEDHRDLRTVPIETGEEYVASFALYMELAANYCVEMLRIDGVEPWGCVTLNRFTGMSNEGAAFEIPAMACSTWDATGRTTLLALYEPRDREEALRRLVEAKPVE